MMARRHCGDALVQAMARARAIGAASNLAAVAAIGLWVELPWHKVFMLTLSQSAGSLCGGTVIAATGRAGRARRRLRAVPAAVSP